MAWRCSSVTAGGAADLATGCGCRFSCAAGAGDGDLRNSHLLLSLFPLSSSASGSRREEFLPGLSSLEGERKARLTAVSQDVAPFLPIAGADGH
uniref:Uncharacterized protein n=1 Tax=Arundo donax TaxID=35708 RepID=A0A0A9E663_ARUDO